MKEITEPLVSGSLQQRADRAMRDNECFPHFVIESVMIGEEVAIPLSNWLKSFPDGTNVGFQAMLLLIISDYVWLISMHLFMAHRRG